MGETAIRFLSSVPRRRNGVKRFILIVCAAHSPVIRFIAERIGYRIERCRRGSRWRLLESPLRNRATCPSTAPAASCATATPIDRAIFAAVQSTDGLPRHFREKAECTSVRRIRDRGSVSDLFGQRRQACFGDTAFCSFATDVDFEQHAERVCRRKRAARRDRVFARVQNRRRHQCCETKLRLLRLCCFASGRSDAMWRPNSQFRRASLPTPAHDSRRTGASRRRGPAEWLRRDEFWKRRLR